jgi:hypothetical protein
MRLESTDVADPEGAQVDLETLGARLRSDGFTVDVAQPKEATWSRMRESAASELVHVLSVVVSEAETAVVPAVVAAIMTWAVNRVAHRGREGARPTVIVWVLHSDDDAEDVLEKRLADIDASDDGSPPPPASA